MCTIDIPTSSEAFAETLLQTYNKAALTLMLSLGHQTGLFDIIGKIPAATREQIALAARLQERYVQEWLEAMVTGQI
jgi:hypothetical protein